MAVVLSHLSVIAIDRSTEAEIVFPGAARAPADLGVGIDRPISLGYVRSGELTAQSWKMRSNAWEDEDRAGGSPPAPKLPFRDYPSTLRTSASAAAGDRRNVVVISARNVMNEVGYQARIAGATYRTARDVPLAADRPVLCLASGARRTLGFRPVAETADGCDFLSGVPLVVDGRPSSRAFLIAHSSDVAHSFPVDPQNRVGPRDSWAPLSACWNQLHSRRPAGESITDEAFAAAVDEVARGFGLPIGEDAPGNVLPHSVAAECDDGRIHFLVVSASLRRLATFLAERGYRQAIVLDQSGSVGHTYIDDRGTSRTLVSTSNYRDTGTCFLIVQTGKYLEVAPHPFL